MISIVTQEPQRGYNSVFPLYAPREVLTGIEVGKFGENSLSEALVLTQALGDYAAHEERQAKQAGLGYSHLYDAESPTQKLLAMQSAVISTLRKTAESGTEPGWFTVVVKDDSCRPGIGLEGSFGNPASKGELARTAVNIANSGTTTAEYLRKESLTGSLSGYLGDIATATDENTLNTYLNHEDVEPYTGLTIVQPDQPSELSEKYGWVKTKIDYGQPSSGLRSVPPPDSLHPDKD